MIKHRKTASKLPTPVEYALMYLWHHTCLMHGGGAPYERESRDRFADTIKDAFAEALSLLPPEVLKALAMRVTAAEYISDIETERALEAYDAEAYGRTH